MKRRLRICALALVAFSVAAWLALGANRGWTKTSVTTWQRDAVTGLDGPIIEERFVPGADLLAAVCLSAGVLFGISFLVRKPKPTTRAPA